MGEIGTYIGVILGSSVLTTLVNKIISRRRDSINLAKGLQDFYEPVLKGVRKEYEILREAFDEKDAAHTDEVEKMREEHKKEKLEMQKIHKEEIKEYKETIKGYEEVLKSQQELHKEKDELIERQRKEKDADRKTIHLWSEESVKKDIILKEKDVLISDLQNKLSKKK